LTTAGFEANCLAGFPPLMCPSISASASMSLLRKHTKKIPALDPAKQTLRLQ
jgi:hypothetical protein